MVRPSLKFMLMKLKRALHSAYLDALRQLLKSKVANLTPSSSSHAKKLKFTSMIASQSVLLPSVKRWKFMQLQRSQQWVAKVASRSRSTTQKIQRRLESLSRQLLVLQSLFTHQRTKALSIQTTKITSQNLITPCHKASQLSVVPKMIVILKWTRCWTEINCAKRCFLYLFTVNY